MKRLFLWIAVIVVIGIGIALAGRLATGPKAEGDLTVPVSAEDTFKGSATAPVTIVEYSDFQCPACAAYAPVMSRLIAERGQEVKLVYRHFPLQQHQYAQFAALVAEAAGKQGKFWEMHDIIFSTQSEWASSPNASGMMLSYIQSLGLNLDQFQKDVTDSKLKAKIQNQYKSGIKSGVQSTPTFFVNGKMIENPRSFEEWLTVIDQAQNVTATTTATTTGAAATSSAR
jgi:protein-disulfide isomerase